MNSPSGVPELWSACLDHGAEFSRSKAGRKLMASSSLPRIKRAAGSRNTAKRSSSDANPKDRRSRASKDDAHHSPAALPQLPQKKLASRQSERSPGPAVSASSADSVDGLDDCTVSSAALDTDVEGRDSLLPKEDPKRGPMRQNRRSRSKSSLVSHSINHKVPVVNLSPENFNQLSTLLREGNSEALKKLDLPRLARGMR